MDRILSAGLLAAAAGLAASLVMAARPHDGPVRAARYVVAPVANPGRVEGTVGFLGDPPAPTVFTVPDAIARANPACGARAVSPALDVDPLTRGVRGAVVFLADIPRGVAPPREPVSVDQHGCGFDPHVVAVAVGQPLRMGNHDPGVLHNLHAYAGDATVFNLATPPGMSVARALDSPGIFQVVCDAGHTWMKLYVHAFEHPYFAVTDNLGRFRIDGIPPGRYQLRLWHEGWTVTGTDAAGRPVWSAPVEGSQNVVVAAGSATEARFALAPDATVR